MFNFFNLISSVGSHKLYPHVPEVPKVSARRLDTHDYFGEYNDGYRDGYRVGVKAGELFPQKVSYEEGLNKGYIDGHHYGSFASGFIGSGAATTLSGALWGGNTWIQHLMASRAAPAVAAARFAALAPEVIGAPIAMGAVPEAVVVGAPVAGAVAAGFVAEAPVLAASAVLGPLAVVTAGLGMLGFGIINYQFHPLSVHGV
jgi:hypothetical protein